MPFGWFKKSEENDKDKTDVKSASSDIDKHMNQEKIAMKRSISILLLGAGGCGKSTVYKQMQSIYYGKTPEEDIAATTLAVKRQVLEDIIELCRANAELQKNSKEYCFEDEKSTEARDRVASLFFKLAEELTLTEELGQDIERLWNENAIKKTYNACSKAFVMDNTPYFLSKVTEIASPKYQADFDDHVRVRFQTLGIFHSTFQTLFQNQNWVIKVTDVGGQRNERKKWIHVFTDVNAVIYVMSLNGYDKVLFEDNSRNNWDETFQLFSDVTALKAFKNTDFIVFLNKWDLFMEMIKTVPFSVYYKDCPAKEVNDATYAIEYVQNELTERFTKSSEQWRPKASTPEEAKMIDYMDPPRSLHFHSTCATDRNQIETVMKVIQFEAVKTQLRKAAIL